MKVIVAIAVIFVVSGCASSSTTEAEAEGQVSAQVAETRAWLESIGAPSVDIAETEGPVYVVASNEFFAEISSDAGRYLIETAAPCNALTLGGYGDLANITSSTTRPLTETATASAVFRYIRPRLSRIRGCRIAAIYDLNPAGAEPTEAAPTQVD